MSAQIICLADRRPAHDDAAEIDLMTAVDVAIRDLIEIETMWHSPLARERLLECRALLQAAFATERTA